MKKLIVCLCFAVAVFTAARAQPTVLAEQGGVKVSYQATKLEEDKKHDKWKITLSIENSSPQQLVYTGSNIVDQYSKKPMAPAYLKVHVTNSKGLFATSEKDYKGEVTPLLVTDGSNVFNIPAGTKTEDFNTNVEKGATPALTAAFAAAPRQMSEIDLLRANQADLMQSQLFIITQAGGQTTESETLQYIGWNGASTSASYNGASFSVAGGNTTRPQSSPTINFQGWDKAPMTAKVDGAGTGFLVYRGGNMSVAPITISQFNYVGADGYNYSARLKPVVSNKMMSGEKLSYAEKRVSHNGIYALTMQTDGNLAVTNNGSVIWAAGTAGQSILGCVMQTDGNLVVLSPANVPLWASGTRTAGSYLVVQDDGNVVIYGGDGNGLWSTKTKGK